MEPWIITALSVYALVSMHWYEWGKHRPRRVRPSNWKEARDWTPEPQSLLQVKQERFKQEERQWLLEWIETRADQSIEDVRKRWWAQYAYWCIEGLDERQQKKLDDHLVFWARRRVENLSQYGPGGWAGTGWVRPN